MLALPTDGFWLQRVPPRLPWLTLRGVSDGLYAAGWSNGGLLFLRVVIKVFLFQHTVPIRIFLKLLYWAYLL